MSSPRCSNRMPMRANWAGMMPRFSNDTSRIVTSLRVIAAMPDEAAHFDHVRKQRMRRSVQSLHAVDDEQVRRDARDQRAHAVQHPAELLDIRSQAAL